LIWPEHAGSFDEGRLRFGAIAFFLPFLSFCNCPAPLVLPIASAMKRSLFVEPTMPNRSPRNVRTEPTQDAPGFWNWLKRPDNQKALKFVGASIVAAIGALVTMGVIHKPDDKAAPAPAVAASAPSITSTPSPTVAAAPAVLPAPTPTQSAVTNNGGNATAIQGSGNKVENEQ
jgi:hypothetical protein